jgi:hypothetical protein
MINEVLEIFDRTSALYQSIIDKYKAINKGRETMIEDLKREIEARDSQIKALHAQVNDALLSQDDNEDDQPKFKPNYIIDAGLGKIECSVQNLALFNLIQELDDFIKKHGPKAATNVLSANK